MFLHISEAIIFALFVVLLCYMHASIIDYHFTVNYGDYRAYNSSER